MPVKPPICCICGKRIKDYHGKLVYFKETERVRQWAEEMKRDGKVGHPIHAEWFCDKHLSKAQEYSDLPISEAMTIIKKYYKKI